MLQFDESDDSHNQQKIIFINHRSVFFYPKIFYVRMSSIMTQSCRRNVLSSLLTTHKVPFFQPPKHVLRNSSSQLFRSSLIRSYSNFAPKERKSVFFNIKKKFSAVQVMHGKLYNINWKEQIFVVRDLLL